MAQCEFIYILACYGVINPRVCQRIISSVHIEPAMLPSAKVHAKQFGFLERGILNRCKPRWIRSTGSWRFRLGSAVYRYDSEHRTLSLMLIIIDVSGSKLRTRRPTGHLVLMVAFSTWGWSLTLVRSNGCSGTLPCYGRRKPLDERARVLDCMYGKRDGIVKEESAGWRATALNFEFLDGL